MTDAGPGWGGRTSLNGLVMQSCLLLPMLGPVTDAKRIAHSYESLTYIYAETNKEGEMVGTWRLPLQGFGVQTLLLKLRLCERPYEVGL